MKVGNLVTVIDKKTIPLGIPVHVPTIVVYCIAIILMAIQMHFVPGCDSLLEFRQATIGLTGAYLLITVYCMCDRNVELIDLHSGGGKRRRLAFATLLCRTVPLNAVSPQNQLHFLVYRAVNMFDLSWDRLEVYNGEACSARQVRGAQEFSWDVVLWLCFVQNQWQQCLSVHVHC